MRMKHEFELKELRCLDCPMFNFWLSFCQAKDMAISQAYPSLCHQCSDDIALEDIDDSYEVFVEEIK